LFTAARGFFAPAPAAVAPPPNLPMTTCCV
jgi:hypothetical protein